ncbi:MAG TPA: glutamate-cysteine ligase family protein [Vicinamibacteria bacterium]|nr:glutamate-cysteine ligase family protein [Vicinamibacteria bacterium]
MSRNDPLRLFEGYGVELEYILVRSEDLAVAPISDLVLRGIAGETVCEVEVDTISWSNELVMHLVELKNTHPSSTLAELGPLFAEHVRRMNRFLEPMNAQLMPSGAHPFMNPREETRLWPHEGSEIYQAFDRVFDCRRHGWANLQSVQLNLSFGDDEEFGRLHAAIRLLLPVMAGLAASTPVLEGELTGLLDTRLEVYRTNSEAIPSVAGRVVPEPVFTRSEYEKEIFEPIYRDIESHDPAGTLRHPWLNARGAIAQFPRDAIEIRVLDMQECPQADVAVCCAVAAAVKAIVAERWTDYADQRSWKVDPLVEIFRATLRDAERTVLRDRNYLESFGFPGKDATVQELWIHLIEEISGTFAGLEAEHLRIILERGPLARRMLLALGTRPHRRDIEEVFRALCRCLETGDSFTEP